VTTWPTGWRQHALRRADVPITQFALDVLHLWEQATPTDRYTNNPLGAPAHTFNAPKALQGNYAQFPTMQAFYDAFKTTVHGGGSKPLLTALAANDKHSVAWRAINGLKWPANDTETDYPSTILDRISGDVPKSWGTKNPSERKTVGVQGNTSAAQRNTAAQTAALHHAIHNINDASRAIDYIVRRLGQHGG
jgi:hypothetical protein